MRARRAATTLLALIGVVLTLIPLRPAPARAAAEPVRIMPLGDSITGSPGCWRSLLWNRLQTTGYSNVDFVGTLPPQGCAVAYDGDNEGHGGILGTNMADQNQLPAWLSATRPDVVLMHLGTNDVWSNRSTATILAAFSTLVDQMRASKPTMRILVAQILPMNPSNCAECGARVVALNQAIPGWAAGKSTAASPIVVVDQFTGFDTATDTGDGVHPNDAGTRKMADRWYPALTAVLDGTTTPPSASPSPSVSPVPSVSHTVVPPPVTSPPPAGGCTATYRQIGAWQGGFQGEVTVVNRGTVASRGWTATLTLASGQAISQSWGGTVTQSGARAVITNAAYNGALPPAGSATAGFLGSSTGTPIAPAVSCSIL